MFILLMFETGYLYISSVHAVSNILYHNNDQWKNIGTIGVNLEKVEVFGFKLQQWIFLQEDLVVFFKQDKYVLMLMHKLGDEREAQDWRLFINWNESFINMWESDKHFPFL